jgi:LPXTG-motif cell wall-anchored protein
VCSFARIAACFSPAFLRRKEKSARKKIVAEAEPEPEPEHHIESESTTGLWAAFVLGAALLGTAAYFWSKRRR